MGIPMHTIKINNPTGAFAMSNGNFGVLLMGTMIKFVTHHATTATTTASTNQLRDTIFILGYNKK